MTGGTIEAIVELLVEDVDFAGNTIKLRNNRGRLSRVPTPISHVTMTEELRSLFTRWIPQTGCKWVFPGIERRGPWQLSGRGPGSPRSVLKALGRRAGIGDNLTFQQLRRYYAEITKTLHFANGVDRPRLESPPKTKPQPCVMPLTGQWEEVFIRDKSKGVLRSSEYRLITILREHFPKVLSMKELTSITGAKTWRNSWNRLRTDADWKQELIAPREIYDGSKSRGYRMNKY